MLGQYLRYWGLQEHPFSLSPDPQMLYLSKQHHECLVRLKYAVYANKGGALLVSENAGDGKTSVIRLLIQHLEQELEGKVHIAMISHPSLTPNQMIQEICRQLGVARPARSRYENLNQLRMQLLHLDREGIKCVVIVDEGQLLKDRIDTLQELRILLNFCHSDRFLLTFVLVGQKPLEVTIKGIPEFWQRLPVRFFLANLDRYDMESLIKFRLERAGYCGDDIFTTDGYDTVFHYSQGCPRVICSLVDLCLLIGYSERMRELDYQVVQNAHHDMVKSDQGFHYFKFLRHNQEQAVNRSS